jgi:predicted CXXCH cytochrome family protein
MKKMLFAVLIVLIAIAGLSTAVFADNGPHGSFTASTDACASCHRAHTAQYGNNGLLKSSPEALCLTCHDGSGAGTNVEDGVYGMGTDGTTSNGFTGEGVNGGSLMAGGFVNAKMSTEWTGNEAFDAAVTLSSHSTTSSHSYNGSDVTVWGSGDKNTTNATYAMECISCHSPHGNAGYYDGSTPSYLSFVDINGMTTTNVATASYRLLRWQPLGSDGYATPGTVKWSGGSLKSNGATTPVYGWLVPDNYPTSGGEWYTIGHENDIKACGQTTTTICTGSFADGDYAAGSVNVPYMPKNEAGTAQWNYVSPAANVAYFCAQCHDRYLTNSALRTGTTSTGDTTYAFMHTSGELRASTDGTVTVSSSAGKAVKRSCVACHVAHGTTATVSTLAAGASLTNSSSLLRLDNRAMCLRCHGSAVGFTVNAVPTAWAGAAPTAISW